MRILFLLIFVGLPGIVSSQEHTPFLISSGGDSRTAGFLSVHLAIGETVVVSTEDGLSIGLGFLHALSRAEPCFPDDLACICERNPTNPICNDQVGLDSYNFLLDMENTQIPPPTLSIAGEFDLTVFNRWGKMEFSSLIEGLSISNWNGVDQDGELLPNGVYYYVLEHEGCSEGKCKGSITILRE